MEFDDRGPRAARVTTGFVAGCALCALALLGGCSVPAVSTRSNVGAGLGAGAGRIFVVVDLRAVDEETAEVRYQEAEFGLGKADSVCFGTFFQQELSARFAKIGVACGSYRNTQEELDEDVCRRLAADFRADEVVWVTSAYTGFVHHNEPWVLVPYEEISEVTLDCAIRNGAGPNEFTWRASIRVDKHGGNWLSMAQAAARSLVATLVADGVVESNAEAPDPGEPGPAGGIADEDF